MPHSNELEFVRQLYRSGLVSIDESGAVIPVDDRVGRRLQSYRPWLWGTPEEQAQVGGEYLESMLKLRAEETARAAWEAAGGAGSPIGLPQQGRLNTVRAGDDWRADFRYGTITVKHHETCMITQRVPHMQFVGLECNLRQEGTDELYGVVSLIEPANRTIRSQAFPGGDTTLEMGPDGQRIWTTNVSLYDGPIEDFVLVAALVGHDDFTDVDAAARNIADKIAETGGRLLGGLTGIPAESVTEETWFCDGLGEVLGFVMGDVFGMSDDPYPGQSLRVPWTEIGEWGPPRQPPRSRSDDPKRIPLWTHRVKVTGRDDGGDYGDYDFYFDA